METLHATVSATEQTRIEHDGALAKHGDELRLISYAERSAGRHRIEDFIAAEYRKHFDARINQFMPILTGLHSADGELKAAVGYRAAATSKLFLEIYTNGPIEHVLYRQSGIRVSRDQIVEVGSLACRGGRAAMQIVQVLAPMLIASGFSWVVFTGADTVRNVFRRLDLRPIALCIANKSLLGEQQHEWGTYYDHNPVVMAGRIADGVAGDTAVGIRA